VRKLFVKTYFLEENHKKKSFEKKFSWKIRKFVKKKLNSGNYLEILCEQIW
jgi:hypothetical protein